MATESFFCKHARISRLGSAYKEFGYDEYPTNIALTGNLICIFLLVVSGTQCSGGSKGARGRAPPLAQNFFIFMQFSGKIGQIISWRPPPLWD